MPFSGIAVMLRAFMCCDDAQKTELSSGKYKGPREHGDVVLHQPVQTSFPHTDPTQQIIQDTDLQTSVYI